MNLVENIQHGTVQGYKSCRGGLWGACPECRRANAEHQANLRAANPDVRERNQRISAARHRALGRLARAHPETYRSLLDEEMGRAS